MSNEGWKKVGVPAEQVFGGDTAPMKDFSDLEKVRDQFGYAASEKEPVFDPEQYLEDRALFEQETQSFEADPTKPEEFAQIVEVAEDNAIDGYYTQTISGVTYNYGSTEQWKNAAPYVAIDHLQILGEEIQGKVQAGQPVTDGDIENIYTLVAEIKQPPAMSLSELFPENQSENTNPSLEVIEAVSPEVGEVARSGSRSDTKVIFTPDVVSQEHLPTNIETTTAPETPIIADMMLRKAELVVSNIEVELGWDDSLVQVGRSMLDQLNRIADQERHLPASQQTQEWRNSMQNTLDLIVSFYEQRKGDRPPSLAEDPTPFAAINVHERAGLERRKKLELEDLSVDGSIPINAEEITTPQLASLESDFSDPSVSEEAVQQAVADAETQQAAVTQAERPASPVDTVAVERQRSQQETRERQHIHAVIEKIEHGRGGFNFLHKFFGDGVSPVVELADVPFDHFDTLLKMQKTAFERFTMHEYRGYEINYGALQKWGSYKDELNAAARQYSRQHGGTPTTKQVVELAITEGLIK